MSGFLFSVNYINSNQTILAGGDDCILRLYKGNDLI